MIHSCIITSLQANIAVFKHLHSGTHNYVRTSTAGLAAVLRYFNWVRLTVEAGSVLRYPYRKYAPLLRCTQL